MINIIIGGIGLVWGIIFCYAFVLIGKYNYNMKQLVSQSLYIGIKYLPYTVLMIVLNAIPFVCILLGEYFVGVLTPIYIVVGFSAVAYINHIFLEKIFNNTP